MSSEKNDGTTYLNAEGNLVFTSVYLKNRGTCCKSACLHCPYGFTTKKLGVQFAQVLPEEESKMNQFISESGMSIDLNLFPAEHRQWVILKDQVCGLIFKNHIVVKHLILGQHFQNQGLSKELIESYYFC